ncbi:hypothetical protein ACFSKL_20970 [Belliella marina]|uniref:Uncharacterized protein n=1 Tax=Belliella marina TaxID=1644146 RepID=A0ABW4VSZ7_9BACT
MINWISNYWSLDEYRELLCLFGFPNPEDISNVDLLDSLKLAISWNEPEKSTELLLKYKFDGIMNEDLIKFHIQELVNGYDRFWGKYYISIFSINQLLRSAYNGFFAEKKLVQVNFHHKGGLYQDRSKMLRKIADYLKSPFSKDEFKLFFEGLDDGDFKNNTMVTWESEQELLEEYSMVLAPPCLVLEAG